MDTVCRRNGSLDVLNTRRLSSRSVVACVRSLQLLTEVSAWGLTNRSPSGNSKVIGYAIMA